MTTATPAEKAAATDPKTMGLFARMFGTAVKNMPPADRAAFMADAAALTTDALGKSREITEGGGYESTGTIEDQWDGSPDDHVKVAVGPNQSASGNGAEKMEGEYSRHAPQGGMQSATEKLGRDIMGMRGAMKSMHTALDGVNMQLEALKAGAAMPAEADLKTMIADAVAKALAPLTKSIGKIERDIVAVKADKESDKESSSEKGNEDEEEDDEADEEESGSGVEVEIENEIDDEDDDAEDDKESAKAAAALRLVAKNRVKWAGRRIRKAREFFAEDKPKAAALAIAKARGNIAKAEVSLSKAKALRKSVGPSSKEIASGIAKAKKKMADAQSENQDKWPSTTEEKVGKSATAGKTTEQPVVTADLTKAIEQISLAAKGMGMMNANMSELVAAFSGQKQVKTDDGQVLPPVFALAKSGAADQAVREEQLHALLEDGKIDNVDFDRAHDVLAHARAGLPENVVTAAFDRLPPVVQKILQPMQQAA